MNGCAGASRGCKTVNAGCFEPFVVANSVTVCPQAASACQSVERRRCFIRRSDWSCFGRLGVSRSAAAPDRVSTGRSPAGTTFVARLPIPAFPFPAFPRPAVPLPDCLSTAARTLKWLAIQMSSNSDARQFKHRATQQPGTIFFFLTFGCRVCLRV